MPRSSMVFFTDAIMSFSFVSVRFTNCFRDSNSAEETWYRAGFDCTMPMVASASWRSYLVDRRMFRRDNSWVLGLSGFVLSLFSILSS